MKLNTFIGLTAALAAIGGTAQARELRIAMGYGETYAMYQPLANFADTVAAQTDLTAKVYPQSLLTLAETAGGVSDGLADAGFVVFPYAPAEFSELNLPANLSLMSTSGDVPVMPGAAMTGATMEYALLNCPDCLEQMKDTNHVYLSGSSTPPYQLLCNKKLSTVDEIAGSRLRAGAANWTRWAEYMGATPISMPGNDTYDAVSQGLVDCTMNAVGDLLGLRYVDIVSDVTLQAPGGVFSGLAGASFNRNTWQGFTDEERAVIIRASARLAAEAIVSYEQDDAESLEAANQTDTIDVHEADPALLAKSAEFVEGDVAIIAEQFSTSFNVRNTEKKIETFRGLLDKWKGLTLEIGLDGTDELDELYWTEIFSKIDPTTYAMD